MSAVLSTAAGPNHSSTDRYAGLIDRFAAQVLRRPAAAVCCDASKLSYAELDRRANRVAARVAAMDVGPGSVVALCMSRSLGLIVGMLGVAKAAASLPMAQPAQVASTGVGGKVRKRLKRLLGLGAGGLAQ